MEKSENIFVKKKVKGIIFIIILYPTHKSIRETPDPVN